MYCPDNGNPHGIIAYTGVQGTGRTVAALRTAEELKQAGPGRSVKALCDVGWNCPFSVNPAAAPRVQMWLFTQRIRERKERILAEMYAGLGDNGQMPGDFIGD